MALAPNIARVAGVAPSYPLGNLTAMPVGEVTSSPMVELNQRDAFRYSDFAPEQKRARPDQLLSDSDRPRRRMVGSLFSTSTESFSLAFAQHPQFSSAPNSPGGPSTKAAIQHGIESYELTSAVIHDELAPRGETVSITL